MPSPAAALAERLGLRVGDPRLFEQALVHSSYINEHPDLAASSNERLEFLGDAVVSLVVSVELFTRFPMESEGHLTTRRAAIVSERGLSRLAVRIGLGEFLAVGQGAERAGERARDSVLAGAFEALCGASYLELGLDTTRDWLVRLMRPELDAVGSAFALKAPKSRLQEYALARTGRPPSYRILRADGPDHARHYVVEVRIGEEILGAGEGRNRRDAETEAATAALLRLGPTV
jgi:ribonuclease III